MYREKNLLESIYLHSAPLIRRMWKSVYKNFRMSDWENREYLKWYSFLQESQWWQRDRLEEYQLNQLKKILSHAYGNVPYYRALFKGKGIKPSDMCDFDDFRKIPFLTKDIVQKRSADLIARNMPRDSMDYHTTSGTSGTPLGFFIEKRNAIFRRAMDKRFQNWIGVDGNKLIILRGAFVEGEESGDIPWWRYENECLVLSIFHMTEELLPQYIYKMEEFEPTWFFAYPTAIDVLASYIRRKGLKVNARGNLKAIMTSSETLYPGQRESIEDAFKCVVFDLYGSVEETARFGECERHEGYHDFMEYGYTEILDGNGNPVAEEGKTGELVSTAFTNYAMPFIRYKTGDLAETTRRKCNCGRQLTLIGRIIGRTQDFIVTKRGNLMPILSMGPLHTDIYENVRQLRFYQDTPGRVTLKLVRRESYTQRDTAYIIQVLQQRIKGQIDIAIEFVDNIPLGPRGKFSFVEQKLQVSGLREA